MLEKDFKVTIELTTKEGVSIVELQRYFHNLLSHNGEVKVFEVKTEVKKD